MYPVKILIVEFSSVMSGAERSLLELVQGLRADHMVTVACPAGPLADRVAELGVPVIAIPASQLTFRLHPRHTVRGIVGMARAAHRLRELVKTERPDVVHANSIRAGMLAIVGARGVSPTVVHCRDALPRGLVGAGVRRVVLGGADHVIAISRHVATSFGGAGWQDRPITVIDNAVDLGHFDPSVLSRVTCRSALGIETNELVLSVIAQITPWKGQDLAIRTLGELRRRDHDARLLVVGEAKFVGAATRHDNVAYERELHALVSSLALDEHVVFLGERPDPERILGATDVLLVPSTEEPFGRTIIEAMAMGVPVAATSVGGPPEILGDGRGGRVVRGRDVAVWADCVEELAAVWSQDLRATARAAAAARFSREHHTDAVLSVYGAAAARAGRPRRRINPATLRVALWTLRSLRSARAQLRSVSLADVILRDPPAVPEAAGRGMSAVLRRRSDSCLARALVRQRWHAANGHPRDLIIGVSQPDDDFAAHAWLEGDPEVSYNGYHEISRLSAVS